MLSPPTLARTYDHPSYADPWEAVVDYRRVREYAACHPDHGRVRVGRALDLPPERVRTWLEGGAPDPVRGVERADDRGWLDATPRSPLGGALATLAVGVFCCGAIDEQYCPTWTGSEASMRQLASALDDVGVERRRAHASDPDRPTELAPGEGGAVLGRALVALGAPRGAKTRSAVESLPDWLFAVPASLRARLARLYLRERGVDHADKATIQVNCPNRGQGFREDLARFVGAVTDEPVNARSRNVVVTAAAAREFGLAE